MLTHPSRVFFLLLSLLLLGRSAVFAIPLDALEKRSLEESQERMRTGTTQASRQSHFRGEADKIAKGKRILEIYPQRDLSRQPAPIMNAARLEPFTAQTPVTLPEPQEEYTIDAETIRPAAVAAPPSDNRVVFGAGTVDTTDAKSVRSTSFNVGVGYKMNEKALLGLEAQKELNDRWDSESSGRPSEEDQTMNVRYKFQF